MALRLLSFLEARPPCQDLCISWHLSSYRTIRKVWGHILKYDDGNPHFQSYFGFSVQTTTPISSTYFEACFLINEICLWRCKFKSWLEMILWVCKVGVPFWHLRQSLSFSAKHSWIERRCQISRISWTRWPAVSWLSETWISPLLSHTPSHSPTCHCSLKPSNSMKARNSNEGNKLVWEVQKPVTSWKVLGWTRLAILVVR